eukprot:GILI01004515.1.p1 GENE.GILI01004515.1~~GILI01004515.1.p1  ORF type:complete len:386 (+),score=114.76 GILI01004515.1:103-1260(+)
MSDWADCVEEENIKPITTIPRREQSASEEKHSEPAREAREESGSRRGPSRPLPTQPPFKAWVGNLDFRLTDQDVGNYFYNNGCDVEDVQIPIDRESNRPRGIAYVTFKDLKSLELALTFAEREFRNRKLLVDVADQKSGRPVYDGFEKTGARGGRRGGHDDRDSRGGDRQGRGGFLDRDRGSFGGRDRDFGSRDRDFGGRDRDFNNRERDNHREHREPREDRRERSPQTAESTEPAREVPAERPRLALLPRTKPVEAPAADGRKPDIFGAAKPRDEQEYERRKREEEEKRKKEEPAPAPVAEEKKEEEPRTSPASRGGFGSSRGGRQGDRDSRDSRDNRPSSSSARGGRPATDARKPAAAPARGEKEEKKIVNVFSVLSVEDNDD